MSNDPVKRGCLRISRPLKCMHANRASRERPPKLPNFTKTINHFALIEASAGHATLTLNRPTSDFY
jgi:hypothetical protein